MQFQRPTYETNGKSSYLRRSSERLGDAGAGGGVGAGPGTGTGTGTGTGSLTKRSGGGPGSGSTGRYAIGTGVSLASEMASEARHTIRTSLSATTATATATTGARAGRIARVAVGGAAGTAGTASRTGGRLVGGRTSAGAGEEASPMTPSARRSQVAMDKHRERMIKQRASSKKSSDYW
jgi:hypothetical protein